MICLNDKAEFARSARKLLKNKGSVSRLTMTTSPWRYGDYSAATVIIESLDDTGTETFFVAWPNT